MLSDARLSVFVPAYNAAATLSGVIRRIPEQIWPQVVACYIVNDGSQDVTGRVIFGLAQTFKKVHAVHFEKNRGYGAVAKTALALCKSDGCDIAVCLHADGQYPPESIPEFAGSMQRGGWDILQGSRIASGTALSGGMPLYKYIAGTVLTFFENRVFGLSMTDYHSGYLFFSRRLLETVKFERLSNSFDFDLEMIASARARRLKVAELPIPTRYAGEKSYLNPATYGFRVLGVMAKYLVGYYRGRA
jgi:glycosyltransferase involved in cell wall biosynthesis